MTGPEGDLPIAPPSGYPQLESKTDGSKRKAIVLIVVAVFLILDGVFQETVRRQISDLTGLPFNPIRLAQYAGLLIGVILLVVGIQILVKKPSATVLTAPGYNPRTNSLAIVALVLGIFFGLLAIPVGHIARAQIRRTGEQGDGLALAGLVLGYISLTVVFAALVALIVLSNA
jgi:MFS family permease